jgi:SAM-dependent methyltransferase
VLVVGVRTRQRSTRVSTCGGSARLPGPQPSSAVRAANSPPARTIVNALENWFCSTAYWRRVTQREVLPWMIRGASLGDHVLEIGAGPGAATRELRRLARRVTSLEYSHRFAANLAARERDGNGSVLQGDAAALPFVEKSFSSVIAMLMLHHLRSSDEQERAFREIFRVLRPGGLFLAVDIPDRWLHRAIHWHSTFVPLNPVTIPARLAAAGFSQVNVQYRPGGFGFQAVRTLSA